MNLFNRLSDTDKPISAIDWYIIAGFGFIGFIEFLDWPYAIFGGDAGVYADLAAGWMWPERYGGDPLIGDPASSGPYITIIIVPILMAMSVIFDNPIFAAFVLIIPLICLQGSGFYFLGRYVFGTRLQGFALARATLVAVPHTDWQLYSTVLPRFIFQAYFPFLLLAFLHWAPKPKNWIWLMAGAGLGFYIDPVSAPPVGFACCMSLFAFYPHATGRWRIFGRQIGSGFAFLAISIPFALAYKIFAGTMEAVSFADATVARQSLGYTYYGIFNWLSHGYGNWIALSVVIGGAAGFAATWYFEPHRRAQMKFFAAWLGGLWFVAVPLVWLESELAASLEYQALLTQAIGGTRYTIPIALLFLVNGLFIVGGRVNFGPAAKHSPIAVLSNGGAVLSIIFMLIFTHSVKFYGHQPWFTHWYQFVPFLRTTHCWVHGDPLCARNDVQLIFEPLDFLRNNIEPNTPVLPLLSPTRTPDPQNGMSSAIRHYARLPVVYNDNDFGPLLLYGTRKGSYGWREWQKINRQVQGLSTIKSISEKTKSAIELANSLSAKLLIIDFPIATAALGKGNAVVFQNARFKIIAIGRSK